MISQLESRLAHFLTMDAQRGRQRRRPEVTQSSATTLMLDGRRLVNFSSNDYLGLSHHPEVIEAVQRAAHDEGAGGTSSALVSGYRAGHRALEQALADFTGREAALVFSSGFLANLAVISTLFGRDDVLITDRLNHASLQDAAMLSRARLLRFAHNDVSALRARLETARTQSRGLCAVITDGVFSMDGDLAPLSEMVAALGESTVMVVDDAHGIGVVGHRGRGSVAGYGLGQSQIPILTATFGKSLGGNGAFVAGSAQLIEVLVQRARPYIYTTALAPTSVAAVRTSLAILEREHCLRDQLQQNIVTFRRGAAAHDIPLMDSFTPIQPLKVGTGQQAMALRDFLATHGFWVQAIRPPTVPEGTARLRITLTAAHRVEDVKNLIHALAQAKASGLLSPPIFSTPGVTRTEEHGVAPNSVTVSELDG
ncbi:MAG: 8-amino-7-oxononanoate synthase [Gammaproteobacteria bacterium]